MKSVLFSSLLVATFMFSNSLQAEEVKVPVGSQGEASISVPDSGMSKQAVQDKFGAPTAMNGPVGEPPISVWKYNGYSVYFEYDRVIHTVKHKQS
jgi:hypothetical protein